MSGFGEVLTLNLTGNGSFQADDVWPGDEAFLIVYIATGSGSIQLEITTDDLGGWVPAGSPMTSSGLQEIHLPPRIQYRVTVSGASGLSGHVDVYTK